MIYVGIDVAKDKHDCFITNSDGEVLFKAFTITNKMAGFNWTNKGLTTIMPLAAVMGITLLGAAYVLMTRTKKED